MTKTCLLGEHVAVRLGKGVRNDVERSRFPGPIGGAGLLRYLAKLERTLASILVGAATSWLSNTGA